MAATASRWTRFWRAFPAACVEQLNFNNLLQVIGVGCGLMGTHLINSADVAGYAFWIVSNVGLVWLQWRTRMIGLVFLYAVYTYLSFQGIAQWHARSPESTPSWMPDWLLLVASWTL